MADVNFSQGAKQGQPATSTEIPIDLIELLFFAYRDFTADPDAALAEFGFGRAHHRVLHFVNWAQYKEYK